MSSEARFIIDLIVVSLGAALPVCALALAWWKGGPAEKIGASIFFVSAFGTTGVQMVTGQATPVYVEMYLDTGVAISFLVLAIRFNNLWLGAAMMVKGAQLAVHATHLTDGEDPTFLGFNLYAAGLNLISLIICIILIGGTMAAIRQRARLPSAAAAPPPAPPTPRDPRYRDRMAVSSH